MISKATYNITTVGEEITPGLWGGVSVDLWVAHPQAAIRRALMSDFVLASYAGYLRQGLALPTTPEYRDEPNGPPYMFGNVQFPCGSPQPGQDVRGYLISLWGDPVLAWGEFSHPLSTQTVHSTIVLLLSLYHNLSGRVILLSS